MRWAAALLVACACKGGAHDAPAPPPPPPAPADAAPRPSPECAPEAGVELIYLITHDRELWSFDPSKLGGSDDPFRKVGALACDADVSPFSMAVDKRGMAWVDYQDGALYRVSILDAQCTWVKHGHDWPKTFGMGFAADGTLYVTPEHGDARIGRLGVGREPVLYADHVPLTLAHTRSPELCGTGDGALWGYFPEEGGGFVQQLDLASGDGAGARMPIADESVGHVGAWAFAQWGGTFYVFVAIEGEHASRLYAVRRKDGEHHFVRLVPFRVVGAGVSTCAPMLERG